ncbi:MAG: hypothetical protein IPP55_15575 [Anaerolineales bacterium]|nr:hypothetical protein [Anaerolineales bacterium]
MYNLHRLELPGGGSYLVAVVRCIEQGNTEALDAARDMLEELARSGSWLSASLAPSHRMSSALAMS